MKALIRPAAVAALLAVIALSAAFLWVGSESGQARAPLRERIDAEVSEALTGEAEVAVIVSLTEAATPATAGDVSARKSRIAASQERLLSALDESDFTVGIRYEAVPAIAGRVSAGGLEKLATHPDVLRVVVDDRVHAHLGESVPLINADDVHGLGLTGAGVVVAVVDSGVDTDHPDLADDLLSEDCYLSDVGNPCAGNGQAICHGAGCAEDEFGHGSHVAGIVTSGGVVGPLGVAPDAGIRAYRVLDGSGSGFVSDTIAALNHIINNHPDTDIITLSLGGDEKHLPGTCDDFNPAYTAAIDALRAGGTTTFASSGNEGFKDGLALPACISSIVSVGMTHDANFINSIWGGVPCTDPVAPVDKVPCASNSDSSLDILAPGMQIMSSAIGGGTQILSGTSQAVPHAAGVAALVLEDSQGLTPDELEECLEDNGVPVQDGANGITRPRVDALACVQAPMPPPSPPGGQEVVWADNNCSGEVNPVDSLFVLRGNAGLPTNTGDCPGMGAEINVLNASPHIWGDVDCNGAMTPVDSLKTLRHDAGLSASQEPGCPPIATTVTIPGPTG